MAKAISNSVNYIATPKIKRPGVHSKNNTSNLKASKNYRKAYRGQGRA